MPNSLNRPFNEFPLVALRRLSALLGASLIPLSYYTMRYLGHSRSAATMAAGLIMLGTCVCVCVHTILDKICCIFFSRGCVCVRVAGAYIFMYFHAETNSFSLENGLVTQSRFATPDIFVLFFGALASYSWTVMHKYSLER